MNEGFLYCIRRFTRWPLLEPSSDRFRFNDDTIGVTWWPDGHISVDIQGPAGALIATGVTQPIHIAGTGPFIVAISWAGGQATLHINKSDKPIPSATEPAREMVIIEAPANEDGEGAIGHGDAQRVCASFMARRAKYLRTAVAGPGERLVSREEDLDRLSDAIQTLREDLVSIRQKGAKHRLGALRGNLRELVYWYFPKKGGGAPAQSYNPLLLRVAARLDQPLPIFGMKDSSPPLPLSLEVRFGVFGVTRSTSTQTLMDLEELLERPVYRPDGAASSEAETYTAARLLLHASVKLGGSHSDPVIPIPFDRLEQSKIGELSFVSEFLLDLAEVVCPLGEHLLKRTAT